MGKELEMNKECVRRDLTLEIVVGVFVMVILFGLAYFTIVLSGKKLMKEKCGLEVVFENVMGLREGDSVVSRGMPMGKVSALRFEEDGVHVLTRLDCRLVVREGYTARIVATSVLGGRYLQIDAGPTNAPVVDAGEPLHGEETFDFMADAAEIFNELRKGIVDEHLVDNLSSVSKQLQIVAGRLEAGDGTLGKLLSDDETVYDDVAASAASLKEVSARLEKGTGTLGKLLAEDGALYENLDKTVASLAAISERVEKGQGLVGKLLSEDEGLYNDLSESATALKAIVKRLEAGEGTLGKLLSPEDDLYGDLSASVASLRAIAERIEKGEGVLGKLVAEDGLYTQLEQLVGEVRATVDDYRETSPVVTFTSLFFGAF